MYTNEGETALKRTGKPASVILVCLLLAALAAGSITGCKKEEKAEAEKKREIVLWHYWDLPQQRRTLEDLVYDFNHSQESIRVKTRYIPDADFKKELALGMADNKTPDIALVDSVDFRYFNSMQPFVDLTDEIGELGQYLPAAVQPCTVGGRVLGLPSGLNCTGLFYNAALFEAAGLSVPGTWEEFYEAARILTTDDICGYAQIALQGEESLYAFLPILWSMGGDVDAIDSPESRQAFELLGTMARSGYLGKESISLTGSDLAGQFADGKVAMMFNGIMMADYIREQNNALDFGVTYLPADKDRVSVVGGEIFGVMSGDNEAASIEFLKYISEKDRLASYIDGLGLLAPRQDIMDGQFADDVLMRQCVDIFQTARMREISVEWPRVSAVAADAVDEVIVGGRSVDEILKEAAGAIRDIREGVR